MLSRDVLQSVVAGGPTDLFLPHELPVTPALSSLKFNEEKLFRPPGYTFLPGKDSRATSSMRLQSSGDPFKYRRLHLPV
jgi:hypothetical protein